MAALRFTNCQMLRQPMCALVGKAKAIPMWPCGSYFVDTMRVIWRAMGHLGPVVLVGGNRSSKNVAIPFKNGDIAIFG